MIDENGDTTMSTFGDLTAPKWNAGAEPIDLPIRMISSSVIVLN